MGSFRHHGCDVRGQAFAEDPLPTTLGALEREPTDAFKRRCELLQSVRGRIIGRGSKGSHGLSVDARHPFAHPVEADLAVGKVTDGVRRRHTAQYRSAHRKVASGTLRTVDIHKSTL